LADIIISTSQKNLYLAPASAVLAAAEVELVSVLARESRLKQALSKLDGDYHFILIDCPPSLGLLTVNGLVAASKVLIPIQSEYYALEGLGHLLHTIERVKSSLNPNLEILGLALTMFDKRTILSRQVVSEIEKHFPKKIFKTLIPRNIRLAEAPSYGKNILQYDSWSKGAWAYKNLAKEIMHRVR
ncbi:MAG: AAA family ATPase, partial [Candidatus Aenigmarchaeota archaeon]|nr:AAA family ATPase [Candidatus Aenigmarchaeota archaeon]